MKVADAPASSQVKVLWYGPGETRVDYRAEVWIGDEKVNTQEFNIMDKSRTGR
jgi:hypothetical protein